MEPEYYYKTVETSNGRCNVVLVHNNVRWQRASGGKNIATVIHPSLPAWKARSIVDILNSPLKEGFVEIIPKTI
jgi:hypothetical protein